MTGASTVDAYYDPFDFDIDDDPYPTWKRLRDEAPLYHNEKYDFYALSRYADVARELHSWDTYRSGKGTTLDVILSTVELPPGIILWEDPPIHDLHRRVLSRVFTPRRMQAIEPLARQFCAQVLDPLIGSGGFDFIADLGAWVPMRAIGYLLGIPEEDQAAIRNNTDGLIELTDGTQLRELPPDFVDQSYQMLADYIDWRADHPSDDLMTQLLNAAIEEALRYEAPSPVQARCVARDVECYGTTVPEGSVMLLVNGSANRDERHFEDPDRFDIHRNPAHLSFGQGVHFCLGSALARVEARVVLEEVIKRWRDWEVDYGNAKRAHTASVRGWARLPVMVG